MWLALKSSKNCAKDTVCIVLCLAAAFIYYGQNKWGMGMNINIGKATLLAICKENFQSA